MNFGSLAGGLAEGLQGGYRTGMLAENLRGQREMDQRRVGIMEANAQQQRELADLQKQQHQRQLDRETRAEEAHKRAIGALIEGTDAPLDRNASAGSQIGQVILSTNALNDPRRLRAALNIYREAGMAKEAEEYLGHLKNAQEQNVLPALDALKKGDYEGASQIYSQMGIKARFSPGSTKGKYRVDYDGDGSHEERDLDLDEMSVRGYTGFQKAKQAALDAANKAETHKAEIELKQADAANKRGDNPTKIRVAEIGAQKALDVADRRANRKGGGKGGAGGDDGEVDWKDAKARHDINADIMNAAVAQFSKTPLDPVSGKKAPDEYSRNLGEKASRVYLKALEGGRPMTIESSLRIANEGQVTYATKLDSSGRLMTKPGISLNGTVYDDGSVEKPATKQQVIEYLDSTRARAVEKGTQITADMLKDVPIDQWAKQAGMKPQELVNRLVNGPTGVKGMVEKGNIDLTQRKVLQNSDGTVSTESSITITEQGRDGKEIAVNIPTVIDGKRYSDKDAIAYYKRNGQHLGKFSSIAEAEAAANDTHLEQEQRYAPRGSGGGIISGAEAAEPGGAGAAASGRGIASESADVSKAKDLDTRISDLREKLGANQRMGNDTTGISRELQGLEAQRKGLNVSPADLIRAELQQVEAEIAKLAGGGMRGAPGRYGQVLAKKKADLERRLRGAEPTSGISREQMR